MYSLLSFQNEVKAEAEEAVRILGVGQPAGLWSLLRVEDGEGGECGLHAAKLSQTLRSTYKIPPNKHPEWWDPVDVIKKELATMVERQRKREEANAALLADAPPPPIARSEEKSE